MVILIYTSDKMGTDFIVALCYLYNFLLVSILIVLVYAPNLELRLIRI